MHRTISSTPERVPLAPEYFRLPAAGQHDPYFGLPRTKFYELEISGAIRLARLIPPGKSRGTTLVPFGQLRDYLRSLDKAPSTRQSPHRNTEVNV